MAVVTHSTQPPEGSTTVCTDELGPVIPRTFPPAPGWSPDGHRIKALLDYSRGPEKTWVYGALRVRDGKDSPVVRPRATPSTTLLCLRRSKPTIPLGTFSSSP